jgi:hypothetical protein
MPQTNDLIVGIDPTAFTTITSAQLAQLVNSATPQIDRGFIIVSTDSDSNPNVPDASTATGTVAWQRYIWLRISATSCIPYVWNPAGANTIDPISQVSMLKWQSIAQSSIGNASITGTMIAPATVTSANIRDLDFTKLTGNVPDWMLNGTVAGGDLAGFYPNPTVFSISGVKIVDGTITSAKLAPAGIAIDRMAPVDALYKDMARVNGGATGMEAFKPPTVFTDANVVTTDNALKIPQVATAGAGDTGTWQMKTVAELLAQVTTVVSGVALTVATSASPAHNLGAVPSYVRAVLVMGATAELGYATSDEVDISSALCYNTSGSAVMSTPVTISANSTNVIYQFVSSFQSGIYISRISATAGVYTAITAAKWTLKIYARL